MKNRYRLQESEKGEYGITMQALKTNRKIVYASR